MPNPTPTLTTPRQPARDDLTATIVAAASAVLDRPLEPDEDMLSGGPAPLAAVEIATRLSGELSRPVPVRQVFAARTARSLADALRDERGAAEPTPSNLRWLADLPLPQWRFWYREMKQAGNGDGIDPFVFRLTGPLDVEALRAAVQAVVVAHQALRTVIVRVGARGTKAHVLDPAALPTVLRVRPQADLDGCAAMIDEFAVGPFAIDSDLPIRAVLLTTPGDEHLLALCLHHTAFDGWSATILTSEIAAAYRELRAGRSAAVREPSSYRRAWLELDAAESDADRAELLAWTRELLGVPDLPLLDTTNGAPAESAEIREQWIPLESLADRIERAARRSGRTPNELLLAAWVRALRTVTGATDFAVGVPMAGRISRAATETIGCFVSAVALRFRATPEQTPATDIDAAASGMRKALQFQFMPLERVLREDAPRDPHRMPFAQAGFVAQQAGTTTLELDGVECTYQHRTRPNSAFELTLEVWAGDTPRARVWRRADVLDDERADQLAACWLAELTTIVTLLQEDVDARP